MAAPRARVQSRSRRDAHARHPGMGSALWHRRAPRRSCFSAPPHALVRRDEADCAQAHRGRTRESGRKRSLTKMERLLPEIMETKRLRLRAPIDADAEITFRVYAQDAQVCRFLVWSPHDSVEVTPSFIAECSEAWKDGARLPYAITLRESNDPIGMIETRRQNTTVDIGYVLARPHWGNGLMPEVIRALAAAALAHARLFRVRAFCGAENTASR